MKKAYIRVSPLTPRKPQEQALRSAGFSSFGPDAPVYVDVPAKRKRSADHDMLSERSAAIRSCRPGEGDEVWIASPGVWATKPADATAALAELAKQGAVLCVVDPPGRYQWHPDAASALELANAIGRANQLLATAAARAAAAERREREQIGREKVKRDAKRLWFDLTLTEKQVEATVNIPGRTLRRWFGNRGAERFVGGPAKKPAKRKRKSDGE